MNLRSSRREFLANAGVLSAAGMIGPSLRLPLDATSHFGDETPPDYTLRIRASALDIGNKHIVSAVTYNGQFPGPLVRFKEGDPVTVEIHNDTDTPEQLHWHGQFVSTDVDGASEEGTPFIPARGTRRVTFTPHPAGFRFYHTHNRAGSDLHAGQYSGQVGPVYIEPKHDTGEYDRGLSGAQGIRAHVQSRWRHASRLSFSWAGQR
jgi:FtsP/CotA-like multicopper oxidase with cupredoxin domain